MPLGPRLVRIASATPDDTMSFYNIISIAKRKLVNYLLPLAAVILLALISAGFCLSWNTFFPELPLLSPILSLHVLTYLYTREF